MIFESEILGNFIGLFRVFYNKEFTKQKEVVNIII